jgi:hypothetical protein
MISIASGVGFLAIVVLGLRWRNHRQMGKKKKNSEV